MTIVLLILCSLNVVLIAMCGWLFGKDQHKSIQIMKLEDQVAQLAIDQGKRRAECESLEHRVQIAEARIGEAAASQEEAADRIAAQIEKKWDAGFQNMMNWNPFAGRESEGS